MRLPPLPTAVLDDSRRLHHPASFAGAISIDRPMAEWAQNSVSAAVAILAYLPRASRTGRENWLGLTLLAHRAPFFFTCIAISGLLAQAIKHLIGRSRPSLLLMSGPFDFHLISWTNAFTSFPSGHTASAFAATVALGFISPRARPLLLTAACAVAVSRVLVGQRYPNDLGGGALARRCH
jgi:membrane-associated phospholipid phosphatase